MQHSILRADGRRADDLRQLKATYNVFDFAAGSVLIELGKTKVLCAVTLQSGVPLFLRGTKKGWLTAEYAMLPASTHMRTARDINSLKKNARSVEISRLISRSLRSIVNLDQLGEKTIQIDCDVLQADGGTRTASVIGSYLALQSATSSWITQGMVTTDFLTDTLCALSVGIHQGNVLLDLDYSEDSAADADFNFVLTKSGRIVELQGAAEKGTISWQDFEGMKEVAQAGAEKIFSWYKECEIMREEMTQLNVGNKSNERAPIFSLFNRQKALEL